MYYNNIFGGCIIDTTMYLILQHTGRLSTVYYMGKNQKHA